MNSVKPYFYNFQSINYYMYGRQPKVILTNVLKTKTGRKYTQRHLLADVNQSDANKLQSDEQLFSTIASLESCQKISSQQSCPLSKRYVKWFLVLNSSLKVLFG